MKKLGFKERMILLGVAIIIVIVGWIYLYYNPVQLKIAGLNQETKNYKDQIRDVESSSKQLEELTQQIEQLKKESENKRSKILSKQRINLVGDIIGEKAREFNLKMRAIKPEKEALVADTAGTEMISRIPFNLQLLGKFFDFGNFLESFEDLPFLIKAGPVSMSTDDDTYPHLYIGSIVYLYFSKQWD